MSEKVRAQNYAPKMFSECPVAGQQGISLDDFEKAMQSVYAKEIIWNSDYEGHKRIRLALAEKVPNIKLEVV